MTSKRPLKETIQAMKQLSVEEAKRRQIFYQKMAYLEMRKLRDAEFRKEHGWA